MKTATPELVPFVYQPKNGLGDPLGEPVTGLELNGLVMYQRRKGLPWFVAHVASGNFIGGGLSGKRAATAFLRELLAMFPAEFWYGDKDKVNQAVDEYGYARIRQAYRSYLPK